MTAVYLSLGSNMGNRQAYLEEALARLAALPQTQLLALSSIYETAAWGKTDQADFLNLCCQLETSLTPQQLLKACQKIEKDLGRVRHEHWGPRTIDIDILLYGQKVLSEDNLKIPHPYMAQRAFVLLPLADIAGEVLHPILRETIASLSGKLDPAGIKKYSAKV